MRLPPNRLHRLRRAAALSTRELGSRVGVAHTTISRLERNELPISAELQSAFSELFAVSEAHLLGRDDEDEALTA